MLESIRLPNTKMYTPYFLGVFFFALLILIPMLGESALACSVIICLSVLIIFFFLNYLSLSDEFRFLFTLCICSFLLRALLTLIIDPSINSFFNGIWENHPDNFTYDNRGWYLAQEWKKGNFVGISTNKGGYFYLVGIIYFLFGHTMLGAKIVNGLIGVLTIIFIYLITREIYGRRVAQIASLLVGFFPSLVLWSAMLLKDTLAIFLIVLSVWSTVRLHNQFRIRYVVIMIASIAYYMQIRYYIVPFMVAVILSSFLIRSERRLARNIFITATMVVIFVVVWRYSPGETKEVFSNYSVNLTTVSKIRSGFAVGGSEFLGDAKVNSPIQALKFLPLGLLYFFFGPFPWQVHGLNQIMTIPEVLIWYCLMPFIIYGIVYTLKNKFAKSYVITTLTVALTLIYTFGMTNMGSLYRYRAQVLVFYLIFAALGISKRRDRRLGIAEES